MEEITTLHRGASPARRSVRQGLASTGWESRKRSQEPFMIKRPRMRLRGSHIIVLTLVGLVLTGSTSLRAADEYKALIDQGRQQAKKAQAVADSAKTSDDLRAAIAEFEQAATSFGKAQQVEPGSAHGVAWLL